MSQHFYRSTDSQGRSIEVLIGYDRPLDYIHCTVFHLDAPANANDVIYSNLSDPKAGTTQQNAEYYRPILESFGIVLPEALWGEVQADQARRVGNRVVRYTKEPRWHSV